MKKEVGKVKVIYVLIVCAVIVVGVLGTIFYMAHTKNEKESKSEVSENNPEQYSGQYHKELIDGEVIYVLDGDYTGEYDLQIVNLLKSDDDLESIYDIANEFEVSEVMSYEDYSDFCEKFDLKQKYTDEDKDYIAYSYVARSNPNLEARLGGVEFKNKKVTLYIWDSVSGVTADCMAFIIFVPTTQKVKEVEFEVLFSKEEYNAMIGKSPIEGMTFTYEDNKIMAQNAYIETDNREIDKIINRMLDEMVKQHTISIHSESQNEEIDTQYDLISSTMQSNSKDGYKGYGVYGVDYGLSYVSLGEGIYSGYEREDARPREDLLFDIAEHFNLNIILDYSAEGKNPYYYEDKYEKERNLTLKSEDKNYIITYEKEGMFNSTEEKYYINKDTYLLEKVEASSVYTGEDPLKGENTFRYTEEVVTVPNRVIKTAQEYSSVDKPIIYLYPEKEQEISVKLGFKDKITVSYPKYEDGWKVLAKPNGDLKDLDTDRNLYSLYYESDAVVDFRVKEDGFVVKGEDSAKFLEEKLEILGLSEREAEEFIVYWLPKLEANKYNYIRFATDDEINQNMPLDISPKPDTTIRVLMTYKGLDKKINVKEQKLERKVRNGYAAVEWGGTEIK